MFRTRRRACAGRGGVQSAGSGRTLSRKGEREGRRERERERGVGQTARHGRFEELQGPLLRKYRSSCALRAASRRERYCLSGSPFPIRLPLWRTRGTSAAQRNGRKRAPRMTWGLRHWGRKARRRSLAAPTRHGKVFRGGRMRRRPHVWPASPRTEKGPAGDRQGLFDASETEITPCLRQCSRRCGRFPVLHRWE